MNRILLIAALGAGVWLVFFRQPAVELGPGVLAAEAPQQRTAGGEPFDFNGYTITPLQKFTLRAKVLSRKNYSSGREADLSPIDLALGWGRMSDEAVLETIDISQRNRWYYWKTPEFPIPRREIETSSANMHMIPADDYIKEQLDAVKRGEIIELEGKLVRADADDGWRWISSTSREDTGDGACEVVYVESFRVVETAN